MVLRGNDIRPDASLADVKQRLDQQVSDYNQAVERRAAPDQLHALQSNVDATTKQLQRTVQQLLCGGAAGALARSLVAPVDRIKILMQTGYVLNHQEEYSSIGKTARSVVREEGFAGLWRGNLTNCARVVPHTAAQFVAYDSIKSAWLRGDDDNKSLSVPQRLVCGSLAGVAAATVTQPLDVVRIRLQTDPECNGRVLVAVRHMLQEPGGLWRNLYKGYAPAILSLAPFIAINFATFDALKDSWYGSGTQSHQVTRAELKQRSPLAPLVLGAISGLVAQTVCYSLDTVRRRQMLKGRAYPSTLQAFVTIFNREGVRGFYRGMTANAIKLVPINGLRFAIYETLKNWVVVEEVAAPHDGEAATTVG